MRFVRLLATLVVAFVVVPSMGGCGPSGSPSSSPATSSSETSVEDPKPEESKELSNEEKAKLEDEVSSRAHPLTDTLASASSRETRFGQFSIISTDDGGSQLLLDGSPLAIEGIESMSLGLGPVWQTGDSDLLLLELRSGGNACPSVFLLLIAQADGIHSSEQFGSCSDLIRATPRESGVVLRIGEEAFLAQSSGVSQIRVSEAVAHEATAEIDNPIDNMGIVLRPLIEADMKMYRWCGLLEQANLDDPKNAVFLVALGSREYKFYAVSFKEELWRGRSIRIGGHVCFTGRYFTNMEAETVLGVRKTIPTLTVFRIMTLN